MPITLGEVKAAACYLGLGVCPQQPEFCMFPRNKVQFGQEANEPL